MHSPLRAERGSITAETVMVLPTLVVVGSALLLGGQASLESYRLHQEAHSAARVASLGGEATAASEGEWLCVTRITTLERGVWQWRPLTLSAEACALNPGGDDDS